MADQTATLTEQHRQAQIRLRAQALRAYLKLWPIWNITDEATFPLLVTAALPLVRTFNRASASLAASYYEALRAAEEIAGSPTVRLAPTLPDAQVASSLYVTGRDMTRRALQAGQTPEQARKTALVRTSGALTRHVLAGGRDTILGSVAADPRALGWARVTDGDPCYFCLTLATRGAIYKTEQSADFLAHDHCGCSAIPVYEGTVIPNLDRWREIYDRAQHEGEASGLLQPGTNSSRARLNAVRRLLDGDRVPV